MSPRGRSAGVWWLSPVTVTLAIAIASVSLTAAIGDDRFRELWHTPKSVTGTALLLMLCGALALAVGASAAGAASSDAQSLRDWPRLSPNAVSLLTRSSTILVCLTTIGTVCLAALLLRAGVGSDRPAHGVRLWRIACYQGHRRHDTWAYHDDSVRRPCRHRLGSYSAAQRYSRAELVKIGIVTGMALPRAFLWSERLAVIELVVPIIVIACHRLATSGRATRALRLLPIVAIPAGVAIFAAFEYFRSWNFYRDTLAAF